MATKQADGSIRLCDGRIVYANSIIQGQDLLEILALVVPELTPPPLWPFVSGGGGGVGAFENEAPVGIGKWMKDWSEPYNPGNT